MKDDEAALFEFMDRAGCIADIIEGMLGAHSMAEHPELKEHLTKLQDAAGAMYTKASTVWAERSGS